MLRSILTAMATAVAASRAKSIARQTAYGAIAIFALMIALVFLSIAAFFLLMAPYGPVIAAACVAGGAMLLALIIFLWAARKQRHIESESLMEQFGLPAVTSMDSEDVQAIVDRARTELRKAGPVKITLAALAIGFLITRLK